jgi:hypothetical protein
VGLVGRMPIPPGIISAALSATALDAETLIGTAKGRDFTRDRSSADVRTARSFTSNY